MPRLDGTGPRNSELFGKGSMAGSGNGNCQNSGICNQQRLGVGYGKRNGNGKGNGQGMGFGFRHGQNFSSNLQPLVKDELTFLKNKANKMENNLTNIKSRISELEQDK